MSSTMSSGTQASAAAAAQQAIQQFLSVAPSKYLSIIGTVASGSAGGATANVIWQQQLPIVPAFCTAIDYNFIVPITMTVTTVGGGTVSPYAPYSSVANQITLGGAPPWPLTELTPWYLDYVAKHVDYDFSNVGLSAGAGVGATNFLSPGMPNTGIPATTGEAIFDIGPFGNSFPAGLVPGGAIATTTATMTWHVRQQLQRKRHLLWGAIPFGDPENRPYNLLQLLPLQGVNPEQTLFVNGATTAYSAPPVLGAGGLTVRATYELAYIDLLPPSMTSVPNPQVGYGLQLVQFSTTNLSTGTIFPITHRTAMAYEAIHQLLINSPAANAGGLPYRPDYIGLWDDQDQQSSRWNFDGQNNTLQEYFERYHRVYHHFPLAGHAIFDFEGGLFPEIPSVTPYDAIMSPDQSYADAFGVPVTPAMTTALRLPSAGYNGGGTITAVNPYVRTYSFGLVRVPY